MMENMTTIAMESISLQAALEIAQRTIAYARSQGMTPIAVSVLDVRGALKVYLAEDGTSLLRADISRAKAWGCLGMGFGSRKLADRTPRNAYFTTALQAMSDGKAVPAPGGILIRNAAGDVVGAVGVSGETSDNDELCAMQGVEAAGLRGDPA
ncbi:GlcG/HbpS family heme-binding protein [Bordetella genomosp. 10]|nr:heme-binding protein [Bordetella genomosp. 10]